MDSPRGRNLVDDSLVAALKMAGAMARHRQHVRSH